VDAAPSPVAITDDSFLSPTGALLSADKERVSDGLLLQLPGKVGRRRHGSYEKYRYWQKSIPSETIKNENLPTADRFTPYCNGSRRGHGAEPPGPRPPASWTDAGNCAG
jgi:hypothetical protein